jgi:hypothetical protein
MKIMKNKQPQKLAGEVFFDEVSTINRHVLVAEPTEAFLEWAKKYPDEDPSLTLEELIEDSAAYLIPEQWSGAEAWIKKNYRRIFEEELYGWCTDRSVWPLDRSFKAFKKYFRILFCSSVIDLSKADIKRVYI